MHRRWRRITSFQQRSLITESLMKMFSPPIEHNASPDNNSKTNVWPRYPSGQGNGLVAGVSVEDSPYGGRCTLNLSKLKRPPVGVVYKLGERMPAQVLSSSLDHGSK
ncbi:hypothetical protein TNCV_2948221 [Trichonephila clavipes]|nr:hypothetical protein TNCV_2948221 [Trichonephila clavipes]